jgi:hypothetical protein
MSGRTKKWAEAVLALILGRDNANELQLCRTRLSRIHSGKLKHREKELAGENFTRYTIHTCSIAIDWILLGFPLPF